MKMRGLCVLIGVGLFASQASAALQPAMNSLQSDVTQVEPTHGPATTAKKCARSIRQASSSTSAAVGRQARFGINRIRRLAMNGAPNDAIAGSAGHTIEAIHQRAASGAERVNTIADRCVEALRDAGADRELIEMVNRARRAALERIGNSAHHAAGAVRHAAERAIGD